MYYNKLVFVIKTTPQIPEAFVAQPLGRQDCHTERSAVPLVSSSSVDGPSQLLRLGLQCEVQGSRLSDCSGRTS